MHCSTADFALRQCGLCIAALLTLHYSSNKKRETSKLSRWCCKIPPHGLLKETISINVEEPVKQLERLIGELLDVSRIQAGRLEYVQEPVDLEALLSEVVEAMQQMSKTHAIVVRGAAPHMLIGDKYRLEQVFVNLISNAIKYSPSARTVEIDVSASTETVTISVHDHGIGIPQEQHEKIFERFYRASDLSQRAVPGLGLGLYIVAEILRHHGGTVRIESDIGHGSTFHVTLPLNSSITPRADPAQR